MKTLRRDLVVDAAALDVVLNELGVKIGEDFVIGAVPEISDSGAARSADPETSKRAAKIPGREAKAGKILQVVAEELDHGLTSAELAERWDVDRDALSPRFSELKRLDLIRSVGERDGCEVYVVARIGLAVLNRWESER